MELLYVLTLITTVLLAGGALALFIRERSHVSRVEADLAVQRSEREHAIARNSEIYQELQNIDQQRESLRQRVAELEKKLVERQSANEHLKALLESRSEDLNKLQEAIQVQVKSMAHEVFAETTRAFGERSEKNLGHLLAPLKEKLTSFEQQVRESYHNEGKERATLKSEIDRLVGAYQQLSGDARNLAEALKGDNKVQGDWGEMRLELLLQSSGLAKNREYQTQGQSLGLRDHEGRLQKPDVLINLPDGKHIIIDSKVSLKSYQMLMTCTDEASRSAAMRDFQASLKRHVNGLSEKRYDQNHGLRSPDFVIMFCPIEGAFAMALQHDPELLHWAWEKRVAIAGPSTLMATLQTVAALWKSEKQVTNALEIAKSGGNLYDKFVGFVKDIEDIGAHLSRTQQSYEKACNKLHSGQGNLVRSAEKLRKLGVKAKRALPKEMTEAAEFSENPAEAIT